jgi:hypothetical protein
LLHIKEFVFRNIRPVKEYNYSDYVIINAVTSLVAKHAARIKEKKRTVS